MDILLFQAHFMSGDVIEDRFHTSLLEGEGIRNENWIHKVNDVVGFM